MLYIRLRMNFSPFKSWKHWLTMDQAPSPKALTTGEKNKIKTLSQMILLASKYHIMNANCLPKSLALKWLLEGENIHSQLKLGFNVSKNNFQGHAWLVHNERVLNDTDDVAQRYPMEQELTQKPLIY